MYSSRIESLPPYLFAEIDKEKQKVEQQGVDVIDFGVGDPDLPTPEHIVDELCNAARDKSTHSYPSYRGLESLREAITQWYDERFGVELDPESEVLSLIGSKEGIAHMPLAFVDSGDKTLVPDPAYPVYKIGTILSDGEPVQMPLREENSFKPNLDEVDEEDAEEAQIMYLNYPNNPTSAVASRDFYRDVVDFAKKYDIIVCQDNAYSELSFGDFEPPSFLEVDGAREVGVEFHSLSKTYNMTGWRLGFVVGNKEVITGLGEVKTNVDSGVFEAVQRAGIEALTSSQECVERNVEIYEERSNLLMEGIESVGLEPKKPRATFYIWAKVPSGYDSMEFTKELLEEAGVVTTPGVGMGEYGGGYVRFALTRNKERIKEAVERMEEL
ncbi:LL-diaminopimelate aminotransferase [archaeon SCG-AAA382B04]|nr:LL-diaminopimelate aminotransferase [archaeon SCG-AAA382B04]